MLDPESILRLYSNVLHNDIVVNAVLTREIRKSVQSMAHVYAAENTSFESSVLKFPNFNDAACRCAYLHKYAPLHTYIAFDAMLKVFRKSVPAFRNLISGDAVLRLCSLGGGPGSDVVGVLSALRVVFRTVRASVTVVDCMEKWESTFGSVLQELKFGGYGTDWHCFARDLQWNYIGANLLCTMSDEVNAAIGSASFVTMMKFISASVCTNTEDMVDKIFRVMKLGAFVLYIDNAGGGFTELIERSSRKNGLVPVVGPLKHVQYDAEALKIDRFGYTSCIQTKVTIILLQKVQNRNRKILCDPTHLPRNEPERRKKLDFVVLEHGHGDANNQPPLDVYSSELNNVNSKYSEKPMNNFKTPPPKWSNVARDFRDFPEILPAVPPQSPVSSWNSFKSGALPSRNNTDSKYREKLMNNLKPSPDKSSNVARDFRDIPGTSQAVPAPSPDSSRNSLKSSPISSRKSKPALSQSSNRVSRISQPVSREPVSAQRYQPVSATVSNASHGELVYESEDGCCSCCVIS